MCFLVTGQGESFQQTVCCVFARKLSHGRKPHTALSVEIAIFILTCEILVPVCDSTAYVYMYMTTKRFSAETVMPTFPLLAEFSRFLGGFQTSHAVFIKNSTFLVPKLKFTTPLGSSQRLGRTPHSSQFPRQRLQCPKLSASFSSTIHAAIVGSVCPLRKVIFSY